MIGIPQRSVWDHSYLLVLLIGPPGAIRPNRAVLGGPNWVGAVRAEADLGWADSGRGRFKSGRFGPEPI